MTSTGAATEPTASPVAYKLPGVNLFASGTYRGQPWPPARVEGIAANIRKLGPSGQGLIVPPAVLGHEEDQEWLDKTDLPAAGWVDPDSVKTVPDPDYPGEVILTGDVVNVPPEVAEKIRSGEFANCSGEFYELLNDFAEPQGFTMRRLGLLGGEVPQVKRLGRLPMPVPMAELMKFAEAAVAIRPCDTAQFLKYSERSTMDRPTAIAAIKAAMPGLAQATLDALSDDQLKDMVANLPQPATTTPPAPMADPGPAATPSRDDMIAALVSAGQDQATVSAMSDADLAAAYAACKPAAPMSDPPVDPKKIATQTMSETQKAALAATEEMKRATAEMHRMSEQARRDVKAALIAPAREALVKQGFTPAFVDAWIVPQLSALDNTQPIITFSESGTTKKGTAFQAKLAAARTLDPKKCFVTFGEKVGGGGGDPKATASAEVRKVEQFCELHGKSLRVAGTDPTQLVATAKKMAERDTDFKAADLIGRDAVAMLG